MQTPDLHHRIESLTPEQRKMVDQFVDKLLAKSAQHKTITFEAALDEFMREHPTVMRLLANEPLSEQTGDSSDS